MFDFSGVKKYSDAPYPFTDLQERCIRDLETTEEPQWKHRLEVFNKGFCCLGRWCVVAGAKRNAAPAFDVYAKPIELIQYSFGPDGSMYVLPSALADVLKVAPDGQFKCEVHLGYGVFTNLIGMNDSGCFSFKEIGAYIRHDPWNIFLGEPPKNGATA